MYLSHSASVVGWSCRGSPTCRHRSIGVSSSNLSGHHFLGSHSHLVCGGTSTLKVCKGKMFALAPSSTFTSITSATFWYGNLTQSFIRIIVLPSGSVLFDIVATDFYLEILWKVLNTSMSSMSYRSISMLWVFLVCEPLLEHDLDLERLPLLGLWCLSVLLPCAGVLPLCQSESCPLLREDLQHELKWFLKLHLWHFLPNAGQSLNWWVVLHLLHVLLSWVLWPLVLCEPLVLVLFLPLHLNVLIASTVIGCAIPPFDLWQLKSFTVISCSLAYWSNTWYVTSSHRFFDRTHSFTSKCLVAWNKSSILCTSFSSVEYWHLSMRFLILWSSWLVDSLLPCLMFL